MKVLAFLALFVMQQHVLAQNITLDPATFLGASECEHSTVTIECPSSTVIKIQYANYGRLVSGSEMCYHRSTSDTNCRAENSMSIVAAACDGKQSCEVRAKNSVFGDPCRGTYKYLEISYVCQGDYSDLGCWGNRIPQQMTLLEGTSAMLDGAYKQRKDPINKCYVAANDASYDWFAVGNHGQCWAGNGDVYKHYGKENNCPAHGEGSYGITRVYSIVPLPVEPEIIPEGTLGLGIRCQPHRGPKCGPANSACITYRCKCVRYWVRDGDHCVEQITLPLAARCTTPDAPCADGNSECRAYRCFCKAGTVKIGNKCEVPSGY